MMNEPGKSDRSMVPKKSSNKAGEPAAERREGRDLAKGNLRQQNTHRTQSRGSVPSALERVRQAARREKGTRFTAPFHYIYGRETLRWAFYQLKREAAAGVDGETWQHYTSRRCDGRCRCARASQCQLQVRD